MNLPNDGPIILFDGVCNFCAWSVRFVIARDPRGVCRFTSLQSELGQQIMREHGLDEEAMDSFVLVEGAKAWRESDAALRVCHHLCAPWRWLGGLLILPRFLRDPVYRFIARNRYRWFGKSDTCLVPSLEVRARFLN
jgi:predicted DCC family thiol-disulfide oxidoreductase YuxK